MRPSTRRGYVRRRCIRGLAVLVGASAALAVPGGAQSRVAGRVIMPGGDSVVDVRGARVTLHRVGPDRAGPLDSALTSSSGRFSFSYRRSGADDAIYFVSSSRGGVAYFTRPLTEGVDSGDNTEIMVFDTTSRPVRTTVRGHHVVMSRADPAGRRVVTEVFDLSNDTSITRVANGNGAEGAVWSSILPAGARDPVVNDGDVPPAAVRFDSGRALVFAPFSPGIKQLAYRYVVARGSFPLRIPLQRPTSVLEVLLEDSSARVTAPGLRALPPVAVQGRDFRRFMAQDVPPSAVLTIDVPAADRPLVLWFAAGLTAVIGGAMTWALARALRRR